MKARISGERAGLEGEEDKRGVGRGVAEERMGLRGVAWETRASFILSRGLLKEKVGGRRARNVARGAPEGGKKRRGAPDGAARKATVAAAAPGAHQRAPRSLGPRGHHTCVAPRSGLRGRRLWRFLDVAACHSHVAVIGLRLQILRSKLLLTECVSSMTAT